MTSESTSPAPLPYLLDCTGLAAHLGVEVRHIRRLVHERRIPFIKWGHLIRFDPDEVNAWLNSHRFVGGPKPTATAPAPIRSLPRRRPAQAEPSDSSPRQLRLDS